MMPSLLLLMLRPLAASGDAVTCAPLLAGVGLHAKDDLAVSEASTAAQCCDFCAATPQCVAFTWNEGRLCRAKGAPALLNSTHVPCEDCISGFLPPRPPPSPPAPRPAGLRNILLMVVDDLRPQMEPYGQAETVTPHLTAFAREALVFDRAYCQQAVCSPSRNSFLSGRRPDLTQTWNFRTSFRDTVGANWTTMPEYFKNAGWFVGGSGKVYHPGHPENNDYPKSWTQPYNNKGQGNVNCPACPVGASWCGNAWCSLNATLNAGNNDEWIATDAQHLLHLAAAQPKSFFVAMGLHKPHTPYAYPSTIDALYPPAAEIALPSAEARRVPVGMPAVAWEHCSAIKPFNITAPMPDLAAQQHRRAYYAAVTHTDTLIGQTLATLESLRLAATTISIVIGDHGYQLGEHDLWCKKTNFELGVRVPFIVRVPWMKASLGQRTSQLAELVDL
jgi:iduronate 2-sulfatase